MVEPKIEGVSINDFKKRSKPALLMFILGLISFVLTIIGLFVFELAFIGLIDNEIGFYSYELIIIGLIMVTIGPITLLPGFIKSLHIKRNKV